MKMKIISIFICLMLMTAFLTTAQNVKNITVRNSYEEIDTNSFNESEVPVWVVGDKWTYDIDNIVIEFEEPGIYIYIEGGVENFPLEVEKVTEDFYELTFNADLSGSYQIYTDFGDGPINITGELKSTTIEGTITFNKTDLGIKQVHVNISGRLTVKIVEQPYFDLSIMPNIPIAVTIFLDIDLGIPYPIINFPLKTSKYWGLPATNFSLSGTIESPWLRLANIINKIARIPGVIPILANFLKTDPDILKNISDILDDILPVINIEHVLNEYVGIGNVFEIPGIPPIFICGEMEDVTILPGTFEAYNISLIQTGLGNIYYAPEVGNIIKVTGNFEDILPFVSNLKAELISYDYIP